MRWLRWLGPLILFLLLACVPQPRAAVIFLDGEKVLILRTTGANPRSWLTDSGVIPNPDDQVLIQGFPTTLEEPMPIGRQLTIELRHPVRVNINGEPSYTTALTVGETLEEKGVKLYRADLLDPPADAPIVPDIAILHRPSHDFTVKLGERDINIRSAAGTVGEALAESGIPLLSQDRSFPPVDQPLPDDGVLRVTRVAESLILALEPVPYESRYSESPEIELGQEQILQPGLFGLRVTRSKIRYEDGKEVSRKSESEAVVRPPQNRVVARGSKVVTKTTNVGAETIQYWRVLQMYATVYSPCNSATPDGSCSFGTASGLRAGKGVVAVDPSLFVYLRGQKLFIPGYGYAVIGDVGGGSIVESSLGVSRYKWIDLGFDDDNIEDMSGWITVYFLLPVPASIPDALK